MVVFRSLFTSRSRMMLTFAVRDSASNTIFRLASRNCSVTGRRNELCAASARSRGALGLQLLLHRAQLRLRTLALPGRSFIARAQHVVRGLGLAGARCFVGQRQRRVGLALLLHQLQAALGALAAPLKRSTSW